MLKASPDKIYRALITPEAIVKWFPPNGFTAKVAEIDPKVGGNYKMSFINFGTGQEIPFGGKFLEMVPNEKISYSDQFDDPNLPGEMITTIELKKVSVGTELHITQQGVPEAIPPEACYLGWQESLNLLMLLVEADIPG